MPWYQYVAYFFSGAFLVNAVPHFVTGLSGRRFPTPFASPPGKGESSSLVNFVWGSVNLVIGYLLVYHVGEFHLRNQVDALVLGFGGLLIGLGTSWRFGLAYGGTGGAKP